MTADPEMAKYEYKVVDDTHYYYDGGHRKYFQDVPFEAKLNELAKEGYRFAGFATDRGHHCAVMERNVSRPNPA